ncbi:MAG TPA: DUF4350 domain-containing protein [Novosphingobium sp.]
MSEAGGNPFSTRAALALVLSGAIVFVALLWMIGAGMTGGSTNDGGAHAGGKGLNGYAALAGYLEKRGYTVRRSRSEATLADPGLLVLTPPQNAKGEELDKIVAKRRYVGPTLVITPKWVAGPAPENARGRKAGWVQLAGAASPSWPGFLDDVAVAIRPMEDNRWSAHDLNGRLPDAKFVQSGRGARLVPLATGGDGRMLAGYVQDDGYYPGLTAMAGAGEGNGEDEDIFPLVLIFEPDLLDNYGLEQREGAIFAERLVTAMGAERQAGIAFDLTLNGHARTANLLTLAFTPPFLAATLCLLLAALVAGWRGFLRFGPSRAAGRAIAFGKRALVSNAAGLIRRSRRLHLISTPYATRARDRLVHALALTRHADAETTEAAIDRALAANAEAQPFSATAARLRAARSSHNILKAAQDLHALERTLIR